MPGEWDGRWVPTLNRWGGWYGRRARPGEVVIAFVGQELNPRNHRRWPPLYGGKTGLYLWRALKDAGGDLHACYYTNARKVRGFWTNLQDELFLEVAPEITIALGEIADAALTRDAVPHDRLPHPAYWQRFHHSEFTTYVKMLKEIIDGPTTTRRAVQDRTGGLD